MASPVSEFYYTNRHLRNNALSSAAKPQKIDEQQHAFLSYIIEYCNCVSLEATVSGFWPPTV
jgi:hypothetical protein